MDKWHGMTMQDIRDLEDKTKRELDEERAKVCLLIYIIEVVFYYIRKLRIHLD